MELQHLLLALQQDEGTVPCTRCGEGSATCKREGEREPSLCRDCFEAYFEAVR